MRLRNRVRELREQRGLSQYDIRRETGLSRMTIRAVERDDGYEPQAAVMTALCKVLDDPDLFWWEREPVEAVAS